MHLMRTACQVGSKPLCKAFFLSQKGAIGWIVVCSASERSSTLLLGTEEKPGAGVRVSYSIMIYAHAHMRCA